ncbi:hypothetical protein MRX96_024654 [Rhipicephalus microplus]
MLSRGRPRELALQRLSPAFSSFSRRTAGSEELKVLRCPVWASQSRSSGHWNNSGSRTRRRRRWLPRGPGGTSAKRRRSARSPGRARGRACFYRSSGRSRCTPRRGRAVREEGEKRRGFTYPPTDYFTLAAIVGRGGRRRPGGSSRMARRAQRAPACFFKALPL